VPTTRRIRLATVAVLVALAMGPGVLAAGTGKRPRPSDVPPDSVKTATAPHGYQIFNDYATQERLLSSQRAVVHYVVYGIDAPPLNDDDADGVPDYVERVGDAADTAIAYFERRGFHPILPDTGGPDARPDLYLSRFSPGTFGIAFPAAGAEGGAFVAIANSLDPSAERSLGSLYGIVAHELFHLVQFSYFSPDTEPAIPSWAAEGSAVAMEARVYPELDDVVSSLQLRNWFVAPERSITTRTYGSQLLWRYLDMLDARVLPAYFARLAARPSAGAGAATLALTIHSLTHRSFATTFQRFAVEAADEHADELTPFRTLRVPGAYHSSVAPLAIHYIRLSIPKRGHHAVTVSFPDARAGGRAALIYHVESDTAGNPSTLVRVKPARANRGQELTFTIAARLRRTARVSVPMLVLSNGSPNHAARYGVRTR
jgi:hypothetical protein